MFFLWTAIGNSVPWGFEGVLEYLKQSFNNPPIYILENGLSLLCFWLCFVCFESKVSLFLRFLTCANRFTVGTRFNATRHTKSWIHSVLHWCYAQRHQVRLSSFKSFNYYNWLFYMGLMLRVFSVSRFNFGFTFGLVYSLILIRII